MRRLDAVASRGVPFLFATGYGASGVIAEFRRYPILTQPFTRAALGAAIVALRAPGK